MSECIKRATGLAEISKYLHLIANLILVSLCSLIFSLALMNNAFAYYWQTAAGGVTHTCASGIECALWQQQTTYGSVVQGACYYTYDSTWGNLSGATCEGWNNKVSWFVRNGYASLICQAGEVISSGGCVTAPPPDKKPSCKQSVGNPIDAGSGLKAEVGVDYVGADNRFELKRYYISDTTYIDGHSTSRMGTGWRTNFDSNQSNVLDSYAFFVLPDGTSFRFSRYGATYYQQYYKWGSGWTDGAQGETATLTKDTVNSLYLLTTDDGTVWSYDTAANGRLRSIRSRDGYLQTLEYDANGLNIDVYDSFGRRIDFTYNANNLLVAAQILNGPKFEYSYLGKYQPGVDPDPEVLDKSPSQVWALEYVVQPDDTPDPSDNPRVRYHYDDATFPFALTGITDERAIRSATWTYDARGRAVQSQHASGTDNFQLAYDDVANTVTVTNPLTKQSIYHFDKDMKGLNRVTQIEGIASSHCAASNGYYAYDANNFVSDVTDEEGRVTHFVRDVRGNPTTITRAYGTPSAQTNTYTWHSSFNALTQSIEPGLTTDFTWTSGQLTQVMQTDTTTQTVPYSTNGQARTWAFTYSPTGLLLTADGPLAGTGDTITYTYNSTGYVATITNEVGQVTTATSWNGWGQPLAMTDPNSVLWTLTYDNLGRTKTIVQDAGGAGATTSFEYDPAGDITKVTRPNSTYLQYTYDAARRVSKVEDDSGASIEFDRDDMGNITARRIKDAGGDLQLSQTATFDELGRLLTFVGANSQTWTHAYDKTSNRISVTDPRSNVFHWGFDALNRLIRETDENANDVILTRNGKDEITNYSDPRTLNTSYVRNGFGDVIQRQSPDSGTTVYSYNALSKPTQITDGRGVVTNLTYDNAGRLLTKEYPASTSENLTYTWDVTAGGNKGIGRVTKIGDASGTIEWIYNSLGQVTQEKKTTGSAVYLVGYAYDLDGNVTQMTYPSGRTVTYARGAAGLVEGVTSKKDSGSPLVALASDVYYEPFGPLQTLTYGNDLILWKTFTGDYNLNTLLVEEGSNSVINFGYGYWYGDFNISNIWDSKDTIRTENYIYTPNTRLQNAYGDWGEQTYYQDDVGNRTYESFDDGTTTTSRTLLYPYDNNRVDGVEDGSTTLRTFTYDGAGNIITDVRGTTTYNYRYNNRNRLDQLTIGSNVIADYSYDGLERMAVRTTQNMTPAATTHYIYDRAGRMIAEASGTGIVQREYVWIDDMPLAVIADIDTASPKLWYVHPDHLNRPTKMTDSSQTVVWDAWYWPYGEARSITGTASNNLRSPGQYFLVESGLMYNWYRQYDPSLGRYTQGDPISNALATWPINLDGSKLSANGDIIGGSRPAPSFVSPPDTEIRIGQELTNFIDGPSIYDYARSAPGLYVDPRGMIAWWVFPILLTGADITWQLYQNGGQFNCIDWWEVAGWALTGLPTKSTIIFKRAHYESRLIQQGFRSETVESMVRERVNAAGPNVVGPFSGRLQVNGSKLEYRAFPLPNGNINVGTIFRVNK